MAAQIFILAVESSQQVRVGWGSRDREAKGAIEQMALDEFRLLDPARIQAIADECATIIGRRDLVVGERECAIDADLDEDVPQ